MLRAGKSEVGMGKVRGQELSLQVDLVSMRCPFSTQ